MRLPPRVLIHMRVRVNLRLLVLVLVPVLASLRILQGYKGPREGSQHPCGPHWRGALPPPTWW